MIKYKRFHLNKVAIVLLLVTILPLFLLNQPSFSAATINQVDVGLYFGATQQKTLEFSSETGFDFGTMENGAFITLLDLSGYEKLVFTKDVFHLQIGGTYSSYDDVMLHYMDVLGKHPEAFMVLDEGWRVYHGDYSSSNDALTALNALKSVQSDIQAAVIEPDANRVVVGDGARTLFAYDSNERESIFKTAVFTLNGTKYRNSFILKRLTGSDFTVINRVTLSEYLYGVLPKELGGGWPLETLKAQAIAAKNFVLSAPNKFAAYGFDVCATVNSQVYGGYSVEHPSTNLAVDETAGLVLTYEGKIIPLYYHSHSGGITDNSENVWSSALPYIKSTVDLYSIGYVNTDWSATLNKSQIESSLIANGYNIGSLKSIKILERFPSGRVAKVAFEGNMTTATLEKDKIRAVLGSTQIKSLLFTFDASHSKTSAVLLDLAKTESWLTGAFNMPTSSGSTITASTQNKPVLMRTESGVFGEFLDENNLLIKDANGEKRVTVNRQNLLKATDIYATLAITAPYVFKNSEVFDISGGDVVFYGHGYGHGLGMSQWGARKMADLGKTYEEILLYYYQGTQLAKLQ